MAHQGPGCGIPQGGFHVLASIVSTVQIQREAKRLLQLQGEDKYDLGFYDFMLRELGSITERNPELAKYIKIGFHCETPELLSAGREKFRRGAGHRQSDGNDAQRRSCGVDRRVPVRQGQRAQREHSHITCRDAMEAAGLRAHFPPCQLRKGNDGRPPLLDST